MAQNIIFEKTFRIGTLTRTVRIYEYVWGVEAVVEDLADGNQNSDFKSRKFQINNNYPDIESNVERAKSYFNVPEDSFVPGEKVLVNDEVFGMLGDYWVVDHVKVQARKSDPVLVVCYPVKNDVAGKTLYQFTKKEISKLQ